MDTEHMFFCWNILSPGKENYIFDLKIPLQESDKGKKLIIVLYFHI